MPATVTFPVTATTLKASLARMTTTVTRRNYFQSVPFILATIWTFVIMILSGGASM